MNPRVYVLARSVFDPGAMLAFLRDEGTGWRRTEGASGFEELVEVAGRVCYMSFGPDQSPRSNEDYIKNLIKMGHESVLEHASWTILIADVSRAFTHQLVRHRPGFSFSQLSQQYHDERDAKFIEPTCLASNPRAREAWLNAVEAAGAAYRGIIEALDSIPDAANLPASSGQKELRRAIRSAARSVLPNATETKIVVTANARSWRHFLNVRGAIPGDEEMRRVSAAIMSVLAHEAPSLFADFEIRSMADGSPVVVHVAPKEDE